MIVRFPTSCVMHQFILGRHDLASLVFFHLECIRHLVQTAVPPHPSIPTVSFFHFFVGHSYYSNIDPEPVLVDLCGIEVLFNLLSAQSSRTQPSLCIPSLILGNLEYASDVYIPSN